MGFFDSISDTVSNVGNAVGNAASSVGGAVGSAWDSARDGFERSDIGKPLSTAAAPIVAPINAGNDILKGNWNSAGDRFLGAFLSITNPIATAGQAFPWLQNGFKSNSITKPFSGAGQAAAALLSGGNPTDQQWKDLKTMYAEEAAVVGAYAAAPYVAGQAGSFGAWAADNPLEAALAGSTVYSGAKSGNVSQIAAGLAPGLDLPQFPALPSEWTDALNAWQNALSDGNPKITDPNPVQYVNPYQANSQGQQTAYGMASILAAAIGVGILFALRK